MNVVTIRRRYDFEAAHFLPNVPDGHKCRRMHGHSYDVEVLITGVVQEDGPEKGMVVDFGVIDDAWAELKASVDHHTLNDVLHPNATVENMAPAIQQHFAGCVRVGRPHISSIRIILSEGPRSQCIYPAL